ncbi:hypothetical protein L226DRAFT_209419 [Lentinus tigrinus ALCF2SS1-7]|uniref:Uncharacterized protein n=1 Tax=Lentinus tigrinus ALCF2SS1-6 TaxID=1328759 RepID=A0A5C2S0E5_9APHY|nr:hypothetical protein L227DRAFT_244626 [Lentinus tigrinus ALCF2SS1-6]RPD71142.1 hypothetical protein L226DRAFT_209419 [Lentinus tigrinus ALCF2SS1-7]
MIFLWLLPIVSSAFFSACIVIPQDPAHISYIIAFGQHTFSDNIRFRPAYGFGQHTASDSTQVSVNSCHERPIRYNMYEYNRRSSPLSFPDTSTLPGRLRYDTYVPLPVASGYPPSPPLPRYSFLPESLRCDILISLLRFLRFPSFPPGHSVCIGLGFARGSRLIEH